jgi:hypothetical protein
MFVNFRYKLYAIFILSALIFLLAIKFDIFAKLTNNADIRFSIINPMLEDDEYIGLDFRLE